MIIQVQDGRIIVGLKINWKINLANDIMKVLIIVNGIVEEYIKRGYNEIKD